MAAGPNEPVGKIVDAVFGECDSMGLGSFHAGKLPPVELGHAEEERSKLDGLGESERIIPFNDHNSEPKDENQPGGENRGGRSGSGYRLGEGGDIRSLEGRTDGGPPPLSEPKDRSAYTRKYWDG